MNKIPVKARIKARIDSLTNWNNNNTIIPLKGEILVGYAISGDTTPGNYIFKIADGEHSFASLPEVITSDIYKRVIDNDDSETNKYKNIQIVNNMYAEIVDSENMAASNSVHYPSVLAIINYIAENQDIEKTKNKTVSADFSNNKSDDVKYPTNKAVVDYIDSQKFEKTSNKEAYGDADSGKYPSTAKVSNMIETDKLIKTVEGESVVPLNIDSNKQLSASLNLKEDSNNNNISGLEVDENNTLAHKEKEVINDKGTITNPYVNKIEVDKFGHLSKVEYIDNEVFKLEYDYQIINIAQGTDGIEFYIQRRTQNTGINDNTTYIIKPTSVTSADASSVIKKDLFITSLNGSTLTLEAKNSSDSPWTDGNYYLGSFSYYEKTGEYFDGSFIPPSIALYEKYKERNPNIDLNVKILSIENDPLDSNMPKANMLITKDGVITSILVKMTKYENANTEEGINYVIFDSNKLELNYLPRLNNKTYNVVGTINVVKTQVDGEDYYYPDASSYLMLGLNDFVDIIKADGAAIDKISSQKTDIHPYSISFSQSNIQILISYLDYQKGVTELRQSAEFNITPVFNGDGAYYINWCFGTVMGQPYECKKIGTTPSIDWKPVIIGYYIVKDNIITDVSLSDPTVAQNVRKEFENVNGQISLSGIWTPKLLSAASSGGGEREDITYVTNSQIGYYTKIGSIVTLNFYLRYVPTNSSDDITNVLIYNFPFTPSNQLDLTGSWYGKFGKHSSTDASQTNGYFSMGLIAGSAYYYIKPVSVGDAIELGGKAMTISGTITYQAISE